MNRFNLIICLILLSAVTAWSQNIVKYDNVLYIIEEGEAKVARQDRNLSGDIVIPSYILVEDKQVPVTSIVHPTSSTGWSDNTVTCEGGAFQECDGITSVTILGNISEIPFGCFYDCHSLTSVNLPSDVAFIGPGAFANCYTLRDLKLPEQVTSIATYTFGGCSDLATILLPENLTSISNGAFKHSGLTNITLPQTVNFIGEESFATSALKNISVPFRSLNNLDCSLIAFEGATNCSLTIPKGTFGLYKNTEPWSNFTNYIEYDDGNGGIVESDKVEVIIDGLRYWIHLKALYAEVGRQNADLCGDIVIPDFVEYQNIIYPVTTITAPTDMTSYSGGSALAKGGAFQNTQINSVVIPQTITKIPVGAFQGCRSLTEVSLPQTLRIIECAAFAECSSLAEIVLPTELEELGSASFGYGYKSYVFGGCADLTTVVIPSKITRLGQGAFLNSGLKSLDLSRTIDSIEEHALEGTALEAFAIHHQDVRTLNYTDSSFGDLSNCIVSVPLGAKYLYQEFYPWINCKEIIEINDDQEPFVSDVKIVHFDGVRYMLYEDGRAIVQRQNIELDGDIVLPEVIVFEETEYRVVGIVEPREVTAWSNNTVSTEGGAFQNCLISSIILPATITSIPAGTFYACTQLQQVSFPDNLATIGAAAFANCYSLEEIFIPESVADLGSYTRYGYKSYVFGACSSLKKINIPSSFTAIPEACFKNCGMNTMLITDAMSRLESGCFELPDLEFVKIKHPDLTNITYTESIFPDDLSSVILLVPEGSKEIYSSFYPWKKFKDIEEYAPTDDDYDFNAYSFTQEVIVEDNSQEDPLESTPAMSKALMQNASPSYKSYLPSGKQLDNICAPRVEGYEFVRWEERPSIMPGKDIKVKAIYRQDITSSSKEIKTEFEHENEKVFTLDGIYVGTSLESLPSGIYLIQNLHGKIRKVYK